MAEWKLGNNKPDPTYGTVTYLGDFTKLGEPTFTCVPGAYRYTFTMDEREHLVFSKACAVYFMEMADKHPDRFSYDIPVDPRTMERVDVAKTEQTYEEMIAQKKSQLQQRVTGEDLREPGMQKPKGVPLGEGMKTHPEKKKSDFTTGLESLSPPIRAALRKNGINSSVDLEGYNIKSLTELPGIAKASAKKILALTEGA